VKTAGTPKVTVLNDREIAMTCAFEAPRRLVFEAWTRPELLRRWYGPRGWSLEVCEIDLKVGGAWRYVSRQPGGKKVGQRGIYQEVVPGKRLVYTESWDDWNPGEVLVTTSFEEEGGRTTVTNTLRFPSQEVRDMLLKSGMDSGYADECARLAELMAALAVERPEAAAHP
jgi:uncharacterized protein YndB with AHSA1/START domain